MRGLVRGEDQSERDLVALRVAAAIPDGSTFDHHRSRDAGWLVRQGAKVAAIGMTVGLLCSDASQVRVRGAKTRILTASNGEDATRQVKSGPCWINGIGVR